MRILLSGLTSNTRYFSTSVMILNGASRTCFPKQELPKTFTLLGKGYPGLKTGNLFSLRPYQMLPFDKSLNKSEAFLSTQYRAWHCRHVPEQPHHHFKRDVFLLDGIFVWRKDHSTWIFPGLQNTRLHIQTILQRRPLEDIQPCISTCVFKFLGNWPWIDTWIDVIGAFKMELATIWTWSYLSFSACSCKFFQNMEKISS